MSSFWSSVEVPPPAEVQPIVEGYEAVIREHADASDDPYVRGTFANGGGGGTPPRASAASAGELEADADARALFVPISPDLRRPREPASDPGRAAAAHGADGGEAGPFSDPPRRTAGEAAGAAFSAAAAALSAAAEPVTKSILGATLDAPAAAEAEAAGEARNGGARAAPPAAAAAPHADEAARGGAGTMQLSSRKGGAMSRLTPAVRCAVLVFVLLLAVGTWAVCALAASHGRGDAAGGGAAGGGDVDVGGAEGADGGAPPHGADFFAGVDADAAAAGRPHRLGARLGSHGGGGGGGGAEAHHYAYTTLARSGESLGHSDLIGCQPPAHGDLRLTTYPEGLLLVFEKASERKKSAAAARGGGRRQPVATSLVPSGMQPAAGGGNGTWGTVCAHGFVNNDHGAQVACRQLGYADGAYTVADGERVRLARDGVVAGPAPLHGTGHGARYVAPYVPHATRAVAATLPINAQWLACSGKESRLEQCAVRPYATNWVVPACAHGAHDIVLHCAGERDPAAAAREESLCPVALPEDAAVPADAAGAVVVDADLSGVGAA